MAHPFQNFLEPSDADAGELIGRDPRAITPQEWHDSDLKLEIGLRAIRAKCMDCAGAAIEVKKCVCVTCPLWPFRIGKTPKGFKQARDQREAGREKGEQPHHLRRENWAQNRF